MSTGPKAGWGGNRPGAGRPKETLSATQVVEMLSKAKNFAKEHGKTVDEILLGFVYDEQMKPSDRLAAIKLFKDKTMATLQDGGKTDQLLGPGIYLPNERPDPAKVVPIKS